MNHQGNNINIKHYISLLLLILLIIVGIWKCPNQSVEAEQIEILKKEANHKSESSTNKIDVLENKPLVSKKEEINAASKIIQPEVEQIAKSPLPKTKNTTPKETTNSEEAKQIEKTPAKDIIVYNVNKKIDKRLPASSNNTCKATTVFKIDKSTIQTSVAIAPDGSRFAVGNHNNYISIMNMEGEELLKLIGHKGYVQSIKYSPNGKFMVSGSMDKTAKLWNANDGKEIMSLEGHTEGILSVAYSLNGKYIASGSLDHTAILWDAKSGKKLFQLVGHRSEIAEVAFSTNSKLVITGSSDGTAKIWDVENGKVLYSLEGHDGVVGGVAFTPDDKLITTSSDNKIRLWNAKTGKHIHTINDIEGQIMSIFISHDGAYISSSNVNGTVKIWKIKGGKKLCEYEGHSKRAREAVFHPTKENTVISASNDNTIRMWKFETE